MLPSLLTPAFKIDCHNAETVIPCDVAKRGDLPTLSGADERFLSLHKTFDQAPYIVTGPQTFVLEPLNHFSWNNQECSSRTPAEEDGYNSNLAWHFALPYSFQSRRHRRHRRDDLCADVSVAGVIVWQGCSHLLGGSWAIPPVGSSSQRRWHWCCLCYSPLHWIPQCWVPFHMHRPFQQLLDRSCSSPLLPAIRSAKCRLQTGLPPTEIKVLWSIFCIILSGNRLMCVEDSKPVKKLL